MTSDPNDLDFLGDLDGDLDEVDGWRPTSAPSPGLANRSQEGHDQSGQRKTYFANPEEFVEKFLSKIIRRRLGGAYTWCSQWWKHEEALLRITAMWDAWEHYREEPLGMNIWLLQCADPHLAVLLSRDSGPFAACKPDRHTLLDPLPTTPAPPGLWNASAFSDPPYDSTS